VVDAALHPEGELALRAHAVGVDAQNTAHAERQIWRGGWTVNKHRSRLLATTTNRRRTVDPDTDIVSPDSRQAP
jgi:hypothetical protein